MKAMDRNLKLMVLANVLLAALYVYVNWAEYALVSTFGSHPVIIKSYFPFDIQGTIFQPSGANGVEGFTSLNLSLFVFMLSTIVNIYFITKLQRSKRANKE